MTVKHVYELLHDRRIYMPLTGEYTLQCPHCRHEHTCILSRLP